MDTLCSLNLYVNVALILKQGFQKAYFLSIKCHSFHTALLLFALVLLLLSYIVIPLDTLSYK